MMFGNTGPTTENPLLEHVLNDSCWEDFLFVMSDYVNVDHWFSPTTEVLIIAAYCVIILVGIITNAVFVAVIVKTKKVLRTRNMLFLNLAISDLLMCTFCIPFTLVKLTRKSWNLGEGLCKIIPMIQAIDVFICSFTIIAIACDRYSSIIHATDNHRRVLSMTPVLILMWMSSTGLAVPIVIYSNVIEVEYLENTGSYDICMEHWPLGAARAVYTLVSTLIQFGLPLVIMIPLHAKICHFLKSRLECRRHSPTNSDQTTRKQTRYMSNMKLLTAVVAAFLLSWVPLSLVNIIADFNYSIFSHINFNALYVACHMLAMSSVFINPLLYGWFNTNFQRSLKSFICKDSNRKLFEKDRLLTNGTSTFKMSTPSKVRGVPKDP